LGFNNRFKTFSLTPGFSPVQVAAKNKNRFTGFSVAAKFRSRKAVKTARHSAHFPHPAEAGC
jgi:hypothetical protein